MSKSWYPPRWRPSYPFGQAALLAAGISPDEARRDRPCPEVHRRKRDANCACTLPCDRNGNCSWPIAKCKSLSWCADVTLSDKRDWGTLKALGPAIGIDSALRPLPRGNALTLLIGEQKCGTTALHEMIAPAHTQRSSIKERHWLDMDHYISVCRMDEVLRNSFLETGTRGKRNLQNLRGSGIALLDATPDYLADPFAAAHAAAFAPHARLLVLVRDPVERAFAAWSQNRRLGVEERSFNEAVLAELPTLRRCASLAAQLANASELDFAAAVLGYSRDCYGERGCWMDTLATRTRPACKRYLLKGLAARHIDTWLAFFPARQMAVVKAEALFAAPMVLLPQVRRFLRIEQSLPKALRRSLPHAYKHKECWHNCKQEKVWLLSPTPTPPPTPTPTSTLAPTLTSTLTLANVRNQSFCQLLQACNRPMYAISIDFQLSGHAIGPLHAINYPFCCRRGWLSPTRSTALWSPLCAASTPQARHGCTRTATLPRSATPPPPSSSAGSAISL